MSRHPFTTEPPTAPPPPDPPADTVVATANATMERFQAPQAPAAGRVMRTESSSGRTEAVPGEEVAFSAPQAPGPASETGAP